MKNIYAGRIKITKRGYSFGFNIPIKIAKETGLQAGTEVQFEWYGDGKFIVTINKEEKGEEICDLI